MGSDYRSQPGLNQVPVGAPNTGTGKGVSCASIPTNTHRDLRVKSLDTLLSAVLLLYHDTTTDSKYMYTATTSNVPTVRVMSYV